MVPEGTAGGDRVECGRPVAEGGEQHHSRRELVALDGAEHREAVELGHLDVENRDVGLEHADRLERFAALSRLADELELGPFAYRADDRLTKEWMIVRYEHAHTDLSFRHGSLAAGIHALSLQRSDRAVIRRESLQ